MTSCFLHYWPLKRKLLDGLEAELAEYNHDGRCAEMLGLYVDCQESEQQFFDSQYHLQQEANAHHANKWILEDRTGRFPILSVSAISMLLFHRLRAFGAGIVPCTRNTYKSWTFIFGSSADPLRVLRRTLTARLECTSRAFCWHRES